MAAMSTALTEFSDNGNSRTYSVSGHTALKPKLLLQKRRVPSGGQTIAEDTFQVVYATEDAEGSVLPQKILMEAKIRRPIDGSQDDVDAALVVFRDLIAGDEFTNSVATQEYLK